MGKKLFKLVVFVVVLLVAGRWLLQWDIRNKVDEAIADLSGAVYITYGRVSLGFDGVITINRVQMNSAAGEDFSAFIQSVEVDMDSLPALIQRRFSRAAPASMTIKITGVNANLNHVAAAAEVDVDCTHPERQPAPWMLGIDADSDVTLKYQYDNTTRDLIVDMDVMVRGAYEFSTQLRFGEVSSNLQRLGSLDLVRFNFDDIRSMKAWSEYCARHHNMDVAGLHQAHLAGVEKYLAYRGIGLSAPAREAYARYLENPERLTLRWLLNINFEEPESAEVIGRRFMDRLEVELAGSPISPIFTEVEPLRDEPKVVEPAKPAAPKGPFEISYEQARSYVGKTIHVVTGSKTTTGTVLSVGESELVVEVVKDGVNRFSITFYRSRLDQLLVDEK